MTHTHITQGTTDEDRTIIRAQTDKALAEWWCVLNTWGWPGELPNVCPHSLNSLDNHRRYSLMSTIARKVGKKKCLKQWNLRTRDLA